MRSRHGRRKAPVMKANISSTAGESGSVVFSVEGQLPAPTIAENKKYPWSPWQVQFQEKALEKAAENLLLAQSNLEHVRTVVESRAKERSERKAATKAERLRAELAAVESVGAQPTASLPQGATECSEAQSTARPAEQSSAPSGRTRSAGGRRRRG
jgi:hypothetical protein